MLGVNNLYGYSLSKFLPTGGFNRMDLEEFESNKYSNNTSKGCVLEVDLEYPKELCKLHNDSPLNLDKIEIRKEILSNCQLKIANFYNIPIGTVKKL